MSITAGTSERGGRVEQRSPDAIERADDTADGPGGVPDPIAPTSTERLRDEPSADQRFRDAPSVPERLADGPVATVTPPDGTDVTASGPVYDTRARDAWLASATPPSAAAANADRRDAPLPGAPPADGTDSATGTGLTPERRAEIDAWVEDNATASWRALGVELDAEGGERVAEAYAGESALGALNAAETGHLAERSLSAWQRTGSTEDIRESVEGVTDPATRAAVARAYASPAAETTRAIAESGAVITTSEASRAEHAALRVAIELDAAATVAAWSGVEGALGERVGSLPAYERRALGGELLAAVADGRVDATDDGVSKMVTAQFLRSERVDFYQRDYREDMAGALARIMTDPADFAGAPGALPGAVERLADRYDALLLSRGGADLLVNDKVVPELRGWALAEIAANPDWTLEALSEGWESPIVSEAFARPVINRYLARGTEPQVLGGEALRNTIGQALGTPPDQLPPENEGAAARDARLAAGLEHAYYGENERIDALAARITELGGPNAEVTIMPVAVTGNEFGAATFNVFKVTGTDGKTYFVEDVDPTRHYEGFADWKEGSRLPPGEMTYAENLDWNGGEVTLETENTALVTDTLGEWVRKVGDYAAIGVGVTAGLVLVFGTGGTAAIVGAGAAGIWTTGRAVEGLADAHGHGQDIGDLSDAEVRALWLDAAAGTLSFGAIGATRGAVKLAADSSRFASAAAGSAAVLQLAANGADVAAAGNQAFDLAANWDELSGGQRAMGLLNVAFWGGMTVASARAGGGSLIDGYSFTRLRNNIEFGTPYALSGNPALQPGEMRVVYDVGENGRARGIAIEHGGTSADPAMLALHTRAARQVELSGGLLDNLRAMTGGDAPAPVGSAAWEARIELDKIGGEAMTISRRLAEPGLGGTERAELEARLDELGDALDVQAGRLSDFAADGEGWIASPSAGADQARRLSLPDAPAGHVWVAGSGEPHLRRVDSSVEKLYYFEGNFIAALPDARAPQRIGHGDNEVSWTRNADGHTTGVTATLREYHQYAVRSNEEIGAQNTARARGEPGDDAGHIVGHRFVLDEGLKNLFPQEAGFNRGAYKTLENELASWIGAGADVTFNARLGGHDADGRPQSVQVSYTVTDPRTGRRVYANMSNFSNTDGQVFNRVPSDQITPDLQTPPRPGPAPAPRPGP